MNTPSPPVPVAPQTPTQNTLPTLGALLGSLLGSVVAAKAHLDPVSAASVVAGFTTLLTATFHFLGSKLGVPL